MKTPEVKPKRITETEKRQLINALLQRGKNSRKPVFQLLQYRNIAGETILGKRQNRSKPQTQVSKAIANLKKSRKSKLSIY